MFKNCFFLDLNLISYSTLMWSVKFHSMRICNHNAYDDHSSGYEFHPSIPDVRPKGKMWSRKSGSCPEKNHGIGPVVLKRTTKLSIND